MITTKYHKISPNTIAKIEIRRRLLNNLWLLIFPAASFVLGATYNNAFLYVGLMLLFLLYPFLMILSYLNTLLLPSYVTGIKLRYVTFDDNEIIIQCVKYDEENQIFSKTGNPSVSAYSDFQSFSVSKVSPTAFPKALASLSFPFGIIPGVKGNVKFPILTGCKGRNSIFTAI